MEENRTDGKPEEKPDNEGEKSKPAKGLFHSRKAIVIGGTILLVLLVIVILAWLHARRFVSTDDAYTTAHLHEVSSRVEGTVSEVLADDNRSVSKGQVIVRLDPRDYEAALKKAQAGVQQAQATLDQQQAGVPQAEAQVSAAAAKVDQAKAQVTEASARLEKAQLDYDRDSGLYKKDIKAIAKADVDTTTTALDEARGELDAANASVKDALAGLDSARANLLAAKAQVEVARANLGAGQAGETTAELQLSYCEIHSPIDGRVSKKGIEVGQRLQPGQAVMAIVSENVWILANLKETQLGRVRPGLRVNISIDALPGKTFAGRVDSIQQGSGATFSLLPPDNATGNFTKIVQRVPVKIVFEPDSIRDFRPQIVPGLSCIPSIDLDTPDIRIQTKKERALESRNQQSEQSSQ